MYQFDFSSMRHRTKLSSLRKSKAVNSDYTYYVDNPTPAPSPTIQDVTVYRETDEMWDVVIKDFHRRSAQGEIFNNPMYSEHSTYTSNLSTLSGTDTGRDVVRVLSGGLNYSESEVDAYRTLASNVDNVINTSITSAYAGVSANEQNAVLWLGEFRETVKMVTDIGKALHSLWQKTKKQREAWAKGKLTIPEAQSLTLGLLYGILPLEESIAQAMSGLFNLKPEGSRQTSRGFSVNTDSKSKTYDNLYWGRDRVIDNVEESLVTTVRAGVLYDIDINDLPRLAIIADPKQLIETAYALARLSFVIDWFINVGDTLKAWSPSVGTNILTAFVSVEETYTVDVTGSYTIESDSQNRSSITGNRTGSKTVVRKYRHPVDRSDLAIIPRLNINLDLDKIFALVLLFARIKSN